MAHPAATHSSRAIQNFEEKLKEQNSDAHCKPGSWKGAEHTGRSEGKGTGADGIHHAQAVLRPFMSSKKKRA